MPVQKLIFALLTTTLLAACQQEKLTFEMQVDEVQELHGFILKGISITGAIKRGCLSNENIYTIKRKGTQVLSTDARILSIKELKTADSFNGEAYTGETVTLYIPDGKKDDVVPGDVVISTVSSCPKGPVRP